MRIHNLGGSLLILQDENKTTLYLVNTKMAGLTPRKLFWLYHLLVCEPQSAMQFLSQQRACSTGDPTCALVHSSVL